MKVSDALELDQERLTTALSLMEPEELDEFQADLRTELDVGGLRLARSFKVMQDACVALATREPETVVVTQPWGRG